MEFLKQSTAVSIKMGPFLDDTDGKTPETGLTISQADIRLSKNGGNFAQTNNAAGGTHDENGFYDIPLDTTDTNTLGRIRLAVSESGALPVWQDFMVVPANVYDSLFLGTDVLQADVTQIGGDTQSATDLKDFADAGYDPATNKVEGVKLVDTTTANSDMRGTDSAALASALSTHDTDIKADIAGLNDFDPAADTVAQVTLVDTTTDVTNEVSADVTKVSGDAAAADNLEADYDGTGYNKSASTIGTCTTNTDMRGTDGANTTVPDVAGTAAGLHATTDGKVDGVQSTANDIETDTQDIQSRLPAALVSGKMDSNMAALVDDTQSAADLKDFADAGYDPATNKVEGVKTVDSVTAVSGEVTADVIKISGDSVAADNLEADYDGTGYNKSASTIGACTTNTDMRGTDGANTTVPDAAGTAAALHATTDGKVDAVQSTADDIETDTQDLQTQIGTAGAGLTDLGGMSAAMKAEVNAEAKDVIATDTIAELGVGVPAATPTLENAIMLIYMALRNRMDNTANFSEVHNDANGVIAKAALSDDGTTFRRDKLVTGP